MNEENIEVTYKENIKVWFFSNFVYIFYEKGILKRVFSKNLKLTKTETDLSKYETNTNLIISSDVHPAQSL